MAGPQPAFNARHDVTHETPLPRTASANDIIDLERNPQLLKQLLDASGVPMSIRDESLFPTFVNRAYTEMYGYTIEDLRRIPKETVLPPESLALYRDEVFPALKRGESWEGEYVIRTKGGKKLLVWGRFDPLLDDQGRMIRAVAVSRDASASMQLRNALEQTERHLKFLTRNTSDCLFRLRLTDGGYDYISPTVESITGYAPQSFYDSPRLFERLAPEGWAETFDTWWKEFLRGIARPEYESPLIHRDGSLRWINQRIAVVRDKDDTPVAIEGIATDVTDRKQTTDRLRVAESSLNFISHSTSDIFFRMTIPDGRTEYISPSIRHFSGYSAEEHQFEPFFIRKLIHPDFHEYFEKAWQEHLQGIVRPSYEFKFIHRSGEERWASQRLVIHKNEQGDPVAIEGLVTDITDRKLAELEREMAENSLHFLSNSTSDLFFRMRLRDGRYDYLSPSVEKFSGYSPEEYEANPMLVSQIIHPDWQDYFQETYAELMRGYARPYYEFQFIHKSGEVRWARQRNVLHTDEDGTPIALEGLVTDVTDFKRTEAALRASEEKYRFLADNISDVVWTLSNDLRFTYATPSVQALWGYTPDEFIEIEFESLFTPESLAIIQEAQANRARAEADGRYTHVNRMELEHYRKDGSTVWAETMVRRLYDKERNPLGYQGISRDITERREAERAMRASEARFRNLFENSPISLWEEDMTRLKRHFDELRAAGVTDFDSFFADNPEAVARCADLIDVVDVNQATVELMRAPDKAALLGTLSDVLPESAMAPFAREMAHLASGGLEFSSEMTHRTKDGEIIWVASHFAVPLEHSQDLSRVIVSLLDVTPRIRAQEEIARNEARFRNLFEDSPISLWEEDLTRLKAFFDELRDQGVTDYREFFTAHPEAVAHCASLVDVVDVNRATLDLLKADSREQLVGSLDRILTDSSAAAFTEEMILLASGVTEYSGEITHRTLDGDEIWVVVNFTVPEEFWGNLSRVIVSLIDVTARKRAEQALKRAHDEMEDRVRQRTMELSATNQRLTVQVTERMKAEEQVLALTRQQFQAQENERQRISRDLHDKVAQDLSSTLLRMETLFDDQEYSDPVLKERGEAVTDILRNSIAEVRTIAYGLRPPALDQLGLVRALHNLCEDTRQRCDVDIDFFATGMDSITLDFDAEINLYRMVQEGLNNMAAHSGAERATVRMVRSHPDIIVRIEDNGRGFAVEQRMAEAAEEKRMGLRGMEERARLIGGSMEIQSLVGTGTRIIFKIPISNARRRDLPWNS